MDYDLFVVFKTFYFHDVYEKYVKVSVRYIVLIAIDENLVPRWC